MLRVVQTVCFISLLTACSSNLQRNAPPIQIRTADSGSETIRIWGDQRLSTEQFLAVESTRYDTFDSSLVIDENGQLKPQHHLTISGGGANGAYGAGLLNGLSDSGNRPEYRLVTGISTGAILGLYAFLGESYDDRIKDFYTQLSDADLYETRSIWQFFSSSSLLNTSKFEQIVREEIDRDLLDAVKEQHLRGRTLLVKTTNLDAQRAVIWNMGAIALLDSTQAEHLFESVIIASASIPGIFEPVLIPIEINGETYDELHVDGGVVAQVFFIPEDFDIDQYPSPEKQHLSELGVELPEKTENHIWIINNSRIGATWKPVEPKVTEIMGRSISTMLTYQNRTNLNQIYQQSSLTHSSFNLSYIEQSIPDAPEDSPFNKDYMQQMYCYGYTQGLKPDHWVNQPPSTDEIQANVSTKKDIDVGIRGFNWDSIEIGLTATISRCVKDLNRH